jgi:hypothetical protein
MFSLWWHEFGGRGDGKLHAWWSRLL